MVIVADLLLFKIASDQIPISVKQLSLATSLNKIHVFIKSIFIIHKIYFHRRVLQNSCSPTIKILEKCLLKCSLINKVTSRMPSTLSKINSLTCIFQLFWTQVLNSHFADHVSVAASEHIVHTFSVKWFRYFHFYTSPYNEFVFHLFFLQKPYCWKLLFEVWQFWSHFSRLWLHCNCKFILSFKIPGRGYSNEEKIRRIRWNCSGKKRCS